MLQQLHIMKSGEFCAQRYMQVITDNIANAQSVGFRSADVEIESIFPLVFAKTIAEFEDQNVSITHKRKQYIQYGTGVRIAGVEKSFEQGVLDVTDQPFDMAIEGDGFFQIRLPDGTFGYTRAGNFSLDPDRNLVTANGHPLEPAITIPLDMQDITVREDGRVLVKLFNQTQFQEIGQVVLAKFPNPPGLESAGYAYMRETTESGEPTFEEPADGDIGRIRHRTLEMSNVEVVDQMFKMVLVRRMFELIEKSIQGGSKLIERAADIMR